MYVSETTEKNHQQRSRYEWLDRGPTDADDGLLVPDPYIPNYESQQNLAKDPQLGQGFPRRAAGSAMHLEDGLFAVCYPDVGEPRFSKYGIDRGTGVQISQLSSS